MIQIIPAILESTWPAVKEKLDVLPGLAEWAQIDVADGLFSPVKTWDNPQDLFSADAGLNLEAHLMINEPWLYAEAWLASPVKRAVFQVEAFASPESVRFGEIIKLAEKYGKEIVLAFKAETSWEPYQSLITHGGRALFLSVEPGFQGGQFNNAVISKIVSLRAARADVKIEVDGGIDPAVARQLVKAGADAAVVGSYIFKSGNVREAIESLREAVNISA